MRGRDVDGFAYPKLFPIGSLPQQVNFSLLYVQKAKLTGDTFEEVTKLISCSGTFGFGELSCVKVLPVSRVVSEYADSEAISVEQSLTALARLTPRSLPQGISHRFQPKPA